MENITTITDIAPVFYENDGGRSKYFKGKNAGDCVVRAIAIALNLDYKEVYDELAMMNKELYGIKTARNGNSKKAYEKFLKKRGWHWCKAPKLVGRKARYFDLPHGRYIARQANHLVAVIDGSIHDTWDSTHKMVYGYYAKS